MTSVKTILAGTVTAGVLALTGGLAYAATAGNGPAAPAPAVTSTATTTAQHAQPGVTQPASQHPAVGPWRDGSCRAPGGNGPTSPAAGTTPGISSGQYGYPGGNGMCCGNGCQR